MINPFNMTYAGRILLVFFSINRHVATVYILLTSPRFVMVWHCLPFLSGHYFAVRAVNTEQSRTAKSLEGAYSV